LLHLPLFLLCIAPKRTVRASQDTRDSLTNYAVDITKLITREQDTRHDMLHSSREAPVDFGKTPIRKG